jgi:hypothetical protein
MHDIHDIDCAIGVAPPGPRNVSAPEDDQTFIDVLVTPTILAAFVGAWILARLAAVQRVTYLLSIAVQPVGALRMAGADAGIGAVRRGPGP